MKAFKRYATAQVTLTLEINVRSTWGADCSMDQVYKQAEAEALGAIRNHLEPKAHVRVIGTPTVTAILATREQS